MARIALAGGGTGGHVYPALAIGDELRARGHEVLYYGDAARLEGRVAPERGYTFRAVRADQFPRAGLIGKLRFVLSLLSAVARSRSQLSADRIDAVLGVGGYISAPTVLAAWTLGLGRVVHEANVVPGLANRLCARVAQHVLLTFARTKERLPGNAPTHLVGVPVNPKVLHGDREAAARRYGLDPAVTTVLLVGGSLGAARINELALAVAKQPRAFQVLHLCGPRYEAEVRAALAGAQPSAYTLVPYEDDMSFAYALADLVVCRAGSSTLAELAAVGVGSLLVPSPNVTDNHQEGNARGLEAEGAAEVLVEAGWEIGAAVARVERLMGDRSRLDAMAAAALAQARMHAAGAAADVVESVLPAR
jgi:UDP-N-acetylglucosamine--N-acetylmuramyl-(pentapeptide) pyrophosphoryl-undecaprenol N-acetylglucosamine transferase